MKEIWKPAFEYENIYLVSNTAKVKRIALGRGTKGSIILKPFDKDDGSSKRSLQLYVKLTAYGKSKPCLLRNLIHQSFFGKLKEGEHIVLQDNDYRNCCLPNLSLLYTPPVLPNEEWRICKIKALQKRYDISNLGRVRKRCNRQILSTRKATCNGYRRVAITVSNKKRTFEVHRMVALSFLGKPKTGHQVMHQDNNRMNSFLSNLKYGTSQQNNRQKIDHGTIACGERSGRAKLTWKIVDEIRSTVMTRKTVSALAKKYGVHYSCIKSVIRGKSWNNNYRQIGVLNND